ncbi:MAG: peptidase M16 [Cyanobacteria bacterium QS_8_64_29]|nr:MAG: peptidase M16 [Cyanobacteria bacterium QS_8_64_29]
MAIASTNRTVKTLSWIGLGIVLALLLAFGRGTIASQAEAATPKHYTELSFPPQPEPAPPDCERYQLDNGMTVYLLPDRDLPLVSGRAFVRTGSRLEPANKVGLAELAGKVLRTGGTQQHALDELNRMLERRAALIETSIGTTRGEASFEALRPDLDAVLDLFAQVLRQPAFAPDKIALAKTQKRGEIARRNDEAGRIAAREFSELVYGDSSPYARIADYATLNNISRTDIIDFYQTYFRPDNIILGAIGDFEVAAMRNRIARAFGDWEAPAAEPSPTVPAAGQARDGGIFVAEQSQLTQSYIRLGHLDGQYDSEDYPALDVMNEALNGLGGRLFDRLRSQQGLAYSVSGKWNPSYDYDGMFVAGGQTQSQQTVPFIRSLRSELERMQREPLQEEALEGAKSTILNAFPFEFEDPSQTLARRMRYDYYDYPPDFLWQYRRGVEATTAEDVLRAVRESLHPERLVTLVVGNPDAIEPGLEQLEQPVQTRDITLPQPRQQQPMLPSPQLQSEPASSGMPNELDGAAPLELQLGLGAAAVDG